MGFLQNLFHRTASHDAVQINRSVCHSSSIDLVALLLGFKSTINHANGYGFASESDLSTLRFCTNSDCLHISICGTSLVCFF